MKIFILNLPHNIPIVRRFKCSYNAPFFLLPPLELSYLAGVTRSKDGILYKLKDYMVKPIKMDIVLKDIKDFSPDLVVTIVGIESIDSDLDKIKQIREAINTKMLIIGYLPSLYPEYFLKNYLIDFILMNEPEETYSELLDILIGKNIQNLTTLKGLALNRDGNIKINSFRERICDIDKIPVPDRESLDYDNYSEPYFGRPFATAIYSRGCPFKCTYCVKTYGDAIAYHSSERMVKELDYMINRLHIKHIRFMDDTFTINKAKVIELCNRIKNNKLIFKWTCLSRADTIDEEMVIKMKGAGCQRVYLGIESGSQKVLDYYKKGYKIEDIVQAVSLLKKYNIEVFGFLMTGAPNETDEDFAKSISLIKRLRVDFVVLDFLMPYPGTDLFSEVRDEIEFSLHPYRIKFTDTKRLAVMKAREALLYKSLYLNPYQIMQRLRYFLRYPKESINGYYTIVRHLLQKEDKDHDKYI